MSDKRGNRADTKRAGIGAICLFFAGLILTVVLSSLPLFTFEARVYTKKSSNTFKGDEKYQTALKEVEEAAEEYRAQGFAVELNEEETLRTNSKGETTSLISFSLSSTFTKNIFSFPGKPLPGGYVADVLFGGLALCLILTVFSLISSKGGGNGHKTGRLLLCGACACSLISLLSVPVFVMTNTYTFSRKLSLYMEDLITEGREEFLASLDSFLFDGTMGDSIETAVKQLGFSASGKLWLLLPCIFLILMACVSLRYGELKRPLARGFLYAFAIVLSVFVLYPYYVMLITAFRSNAETTDMYFLHLLPTKWEWGNLTDIINRGVPRYLMNSVMIAGGATVISLLCGVPAAYALARMEFKGKKAFLGFVIMSQMFSPVVLLIGIAQLMSTLGLSDSIMGLMFINAAFNQAFAIWLLRGTFVSISPEMEEAARIDGCTMMQSLLKVLIPMSAPGIVTVLIFVFINAWNEYTISTVLISTAENRPITVGITQFSSFNMIEWQYLFAASLLATIPVVILFMFIEKYLVSGLTSGGVKG